MRFISSLIVVVAFVGGQAMADNFDQLRKDNTLVVHPQLEQTLSTEQLKAKLAELKYKPGEQQGDPISEVVAQLLYTAEDKSAEVINGLTVNELIAENSFVPYGDCSKEAFKKRADIYYKSMPRGPGSSGAQYAVTVYLVKCLLMATDYCVKHTEGVFTYKVATKKFMKELRRALELDHMNWVINEDLLRMDVYEAFQSKVAVFLEKGLEAARRGKRYYVNVEEHILGKDLYYGPSDDVA